MDRQHYVDLLLENENLTANLTDAPANVLLEWGITRVDEIVSGSTDPDLVEMRFSGLIRSMRGINRLIGKLPDILAEDVARIAEHYREAFETAPEIDESQSAELALRLSEQDESQIITTLLGWLNPTPPPPTENLPENLI